MFTLWSLLSVFPRLLVPRLAHFQLVGRYVRVPHIIQHVLPFSYVFTLLN